jgi:hypothetical protein
VVREDLKEMAEKYGHNVCLALIAAFEKEFGPDGKKLEYKQRVDQFVQACGGVRKDCRFAREVKRNGREKSL